MISCGMVVMRYGCTLFLIMLFMLLFYCTSLMHPGYSSQLLTKRDWRPLPLELVLGKTRNCTWGVRLAHRYTYCGSGRTQWHLQGVALAVAYRLVPMISEVAPVNERV